MKHVRNLIAGMWTDSDEHRETINPATGEPLATFALATQADTEAAIEAAHQVHTAGDYAADRQARSLLLHRIADGFDAHFAEFVELLGTENGKVHAHGTTEMDFVSPTLRFNAALANTDMGRAASAAKGHLGIAIREPAGVAGIIAPWNSPVALSIRSLAPAIAAGCPAVVSLPGSTALINNRIAEIIAEAMATLPSIPTGAISVLTGGHVSGDALVRSPLVPSISFTGSTKTGIAITANAAPRLKRLGLELGGKTPMMVFDDADIDTAVSTSVAALTVFSGQFCMTGSRILVQEGIADEFLSRYVDALAAITVGAAADPASEMGPIIDRANVERIDGVVRSALEAGAQSLLRGGPLTKESAPGGAFYSPTVLEVTDDSLPIVQDEVFGPVATVQRFVTEEQAIRSANSTEYGLSASVFTTDHDRAIRVSRAIEAGSVWINHWATLFNQFEEDGYKLSGQGRMRGLAVLDDFLECKYIGLTAPSN